MRLHFPHSCQKKTIVRFAPLIFPNIVHVINCLFQPPPCPDRFSVNPHTLAYLPFMEFKILDRHNAVDQLGPGINLIG